MGDEPQTGFLWESLCLKAMRDLQYVWEKTENSTDDISIIFSSRPSQPKKNYIKAGIDKDDSLPELQLTMMMMSTGGEEVNVHNADANSICSPDAENSPSISAVQHSLL